MIWLPENKAQRAPQILIGGGLIYGGGGGVAFTNLYATLFDGINESAIGTTALNALLERNVPWSISFWTKMDSVAGDRLILSTADNAGNYRGLWLYGRISGANVLEIQYYSDAGSGDWLAVRTTAVPTTWTHYLICFDGSGNRTGFAIYKNGVLETNSYPYGAASVTGTTTGISKLTWGAGDEGTTQCYGGSIDEGAVFNTDKRSAVSAIYNGGVTHNLSLISGIQGYWRFGDTSYNAHPTIANVITPGTCDLTMTNMESTDFVADVP